MLRDLDIQPPLDVQQLCQRVGEQRGRPIRLLSHAIPVPGPFGVWIATDTEDYILYQRETTKAHQDHIVLHELGHILAGHSSEEQDDDLLRSLYPDLAPEVVRRALRRTAYDNDHELEAEMVATIILEWASVLDPVAAESNHRRAVARMESALGDRMGWL